MHKFVPLLYSYIPAPTRFGSSLPSSGNFCIRLSYMKIQIDLVVYHIMLSGLCVGVSWFRLLCFCIFAELRRLKKLPEVARLLPKHVGASIYEYNSGVNLCIVLVISTASNNARYEN
jgi:hypothetical protein